MNITINIYGDVCVNCDGCGCYYCEDFDEEYTENDSCNAEQPVSPEEAEAAVKRVVEALFPHIRVELDD